MSEPSERQPDYPPPPFDNLPQFREQHSFTMNTHGIIGIVAISLMTAFAFLHKWNIDWPYFVIAISIYSIVIIGHSTSKESLPIRLMVGYHIAFLLLAGGMWLHVEGFFGQAAIFIAAVAVGLAIPFLLVRKR